MSYSNLSSLFSDIADAIRTKTGLANTIKAEDFPTAINNIPSGSEGATIEVVDCIRFPYHNQTNKIFVPCSQTAVLAFQNGHLSGALIPSWRSTSSTINPNNYFSQKNVILCFIFKDSVVTQIYGLQSNVETIPLATMQDMRNSFSYGIDDYTGQGATGHNISFAYDTSSWTTYYFADTLINATQQNDYFRWQAILAY